MAESALDLFTLGEAMAVVRGRDIAVFRPGFAAELSFAGAESNVAIVASRLGHRTAWCGRLGADDAGMMILNGLRGEGVDVSTVRTEPEAATGLMLRHRRTADRTAVTYYRFGQAGSHLAPADVPEHAIPAARILHITGITPALSPTAAAAVDHAVKLARDAGVTVSMDVNYRARLWSRENAAPVLTGLATQADIVFAGADEAALILGGPLEATPEELLLGVSELASGQAVLKLGPDGALALAGGEIVRAAGLAVSELDPVGAGDAFVAGYLSGVLDGLPLRHRLARANQCGAFAVSTFGDWEGAPYRRELALLTSSEDVLR